MNRRKFVAGTGLLVGASLVASGLPSGALADGDVINQLNPVKPKKAEQKGRIDVHHHLVPPAFAQVMERKGLMAVAGASLPAWTVEHSLEVMGANDIQTAILSLSAPGVFFGEARQAVDLARRCNEFSSDICARFPTRFGSFAVLPMPLTEASCAEATFALDTLKANGVVLFGSSDGKFLGDPDFDELMAELNNRSAIVFVHPNLHPSSEKLNLQTPSFLVEFVCDTTRAAVNLMLSGTMEKYPRINWILAHAGGFLPYAAWRLSLGNALPELSERAPQGVLSYLRRFYFDTALSPSAYSMAVLKELVEPSHVLFGSDFPFAPSSMTALQTQTLKSSHVWSQNVKFGIDRSHALSLFPQFKTTGELVSAAPVYESESTGQWVGRTLKKPFAALAQHLKD
jgi:predicted TIM-barrel fold metal-dependent hydrolase